MIKRRNLTKRKVKMLTKTLKKRKEKYKRAIKLDK